MKKSQWYLPALFVVALAASSPVYAHEGDGRDGNGWNGHHQKSECEIRRIPEAKMRLLHDAMKASFEKDKGLHEKAHKLHEELRNVLAADAFDKKAFLNLTAKLEDIHSRLLHDRTEAFASVAGQFTPEERKELARMFHKHHHHFHHDASWHHDGGHDGGHEHEWHHDHEWKHGDEQPMNDESLQPQGRDKDYPPYSPR